MPSPPTSAARKTPRSTRQSKKKEKLGDTTGPKNDEAESPSDVGTPEISFNKKMTASKLRLFDSSPLNELLTVRDLQAAVAEVNAEFPTSETHGDDKSPARRSKRLLEQIKPTETTGDDNQTEAAVSNKKRKIPGKAPKTPDRNANTGRGVASVAIETLTDSMGGGKAKRSGNRCKRKAITTKSLSDETADHAEDVVTSSIEKKGKKDKKDKKDKTKHSQNAESGEEPSSEKTQDETKAGSLLGSKENMSSGRETVSIDADRKKSKGKKQAVHKNESKSSVKEKMKVAKTDKHAKPTVASENDKTAEKSAIIKDILESENTGDDASDVVTDNEEAPTPQKPAKSMNELGGIRTSSRPASKRALLKNGTQPGAPESVEPSEEEPDASANGKHNKVQKNKRNTRNSMQVGKRSDIELSGQQRAKHGVIYIGHIPQGFFEDQMKGYFSQFGAVKRVRVCRAKKSGRSRGYAFVEFAEKEVAIIAADAMDGYMMDGKSLVAKYVPAEKVHADTFKPRTKAVRTEKWSAVERRALLKRSTEPAKVAERSKRIQKTTQKKKDRLARLNVSYKFPTVQPA